MAIDATDLHSFAPRLYSIVVGALYNQLAGALVYGPLFGKVWIEAMNKVLCSRQGLWHPAMMSLSFPFKQRSFFLLIFVLLCKTRSVGQGRRGLGGR